MSLFRKFKRKEDDDLLLDMSELNEEDNLYLKSSHKWGEGATRPSHAMTADEIRSGNLAEQQVVDGISPAAESVLGKVSAVPVKKNLIEDIPMQKDEPTSDGEDFLKRCQLKIAAENSEQQKPDIDKIIEKLKRDALADADSDPVEKALEALEKVVATPEAVVPNISVSEEKLENDGEVEFITEEKVLQAPVEELSMERTLEIPQLEAMEQKANKTADDITKAIDLAKAVVEEEKTFLGIEQVENLEETKVLDTAAIEEKATSEENTDNTISFNAIEDQKLPDFEEIEDEEDEEEFDEYFEEYTNLDDAPNLKIRSLSLIKKRIAQTIFSALLSILLIAFTFPSLNDLGVTGYVNLGAVVLAILSSPYILSSVKKLSHGKITTDFAILLAAILTIVQLCVNIFAAGGNLAVTGVAVTVLVFFNNIANLLRERRIKNGLEIIATSREKTAAVVLDRQKDTAALANGSVEGDAVAVVGKKTTNLLGFMRRNLSKGIVEEHLHIVVFALLGISVVSGIVLSIIFGLQIGICVAALIYSLGLPAGVSLIGELPLKLMSDRLAHYNAAIAGFDGADELNSSNIVTADVCDIFPSGTVTLVNMKAFNNNDLAKTITYAAAVTKAANSPLFNIFEKIIGATELDSLPIAEEVNYEDKMGISGWIGEERVFIGDRNLLQGHSIKVSPMSVDKDILRNGYFPVYVARGNKPCMLLSVKYNVDPNVAYELQSIANTGMTVLISNRDPNVTEETVCDYFDLPDDSVKIMTNRTVNSLNKITEYSESVDAPAVYSGDICGLFAAISSSIKLFPTIKVLSVLSLVLSVCIIAALIYATAVGTASALITPLNLAALQIVCTIILSSVAHTRK